MNRLTLRRLLLPCLSLAMLATATPTHASVGEAYGDSMELLRAGRFNEARAAFEALLARHPDTAYSDNARYWIGETYYAQRDYLTAMAAFRRVLAKHPHEPKAPDALFKIALCNQELGRDRGYRNTLTSLRARFPEAEITARAEGILAKLEGAEQPLSEEPVITAAFPAAPIVTPPPAVLEPARPKGPAAIAETTRFEDQGMIATLPAPPSRETLRQLHDYLIDKREQLENQANDELTPHEILVTVVAPGGLLYMAHRHLEKERAAEELATIDQDFALLESEEAAAMERQPRMIAGIAMR